MQALTLNTTTRSTRHTHTHPIPTPLPTEALIHIHAVALNPVDALYVAHPLGATGRVIGSDFAGTVISLPTASTSPTSPPNHRHHALRLNDRVAGFVQGACSTNPLPGAFAEFVTCEPDLLWRIPEGMSFRDAAAVSLCALTAAQALFLRMGLRAPWDGGERRELERGREGAGEGEGRREMVVFIYGASTSVGMYAAQLVRAAREAGGLRVRLVGAAGERHFGVLRERPYCYDHLVDYRGNWEGEVRKLAPDGVDVAYDCISEGLTVSKIAHLTKKEGKMAVVRSREGGAWVDDGRMPVEPSYGAVWEGLGREVQYQGMHLPPNPAARAFTVAFYRWLSEEGSIVPNPVRAMPNGLAGIRDDGLPLLGYGTMEDRGLERKEDWMRPISGEKLVYDLITDMGYD